MSNSIPTRLLKPSILLLLLLLAACHNPSPWGRQGEIADSLIEQHPDSVLHLLQDIDYAALDEEGQAHYGLLLTAARYKLYQPVDTTFINRSIAYYSASHKGIQFSPSWGDKRGALGASLYYKAVVIYDLGKKQEATLLLKQAEQQAELSDDELLRNKIYENLEMVNSDARLYQLALRYAKKFVESSCRLHDTLCIMRSLDHQAVLYGKLGYADSMRAIYNKMDPIVKGRNDSIVASILGNMAYCHMTSGQYAKAQAKLKRAMQIKPLVSHYMMMGKLHEMNGDTARARTNWETAFTFHDDEYDVKAYLALAQLYHQRSDFRQEAQYLNKANGLLDNQGHTTESVRIMDTQRHFDEESHAQRQSRQMAVLALTILFAFMMMLAIVTAYKQRLRHVTNTEMRKLADVSNKISHLEMLRRGYEKEMSLYRREIDQMQHERSRYQSKVGQLESKLEETAEKMKAATREKQEMEQYMTKVSLHAERALLNGKNIFDTMCDGQKAVRLTKQDEQDFVNYYMVAHHTDYARISKPYHDLPLRLQSFLILTELGKTPKEMEEIFCVSPSSIKAYRHRLKELQRHDMA